MVRFILVLFLIAGSLFVFIGNKKIPLNIYNLDDTYAIMDGESCSDIKSKDDELLECEKALKGEKYTLRTYFSQEDCENTYHSCKVNENKLFEPVSVGTFVVKYRRIDAKYGSDQIVVDAYGLHQLKGKGLDKTIMEKERLEEWKGIYKSDENDMISILDFMKSDMSKDYLLKVYNLK